MCGSSLTIAAISWNAPGMKAGLSSCASASACSGGSRERALRRVVLDVAARRLLAQPLAQVALAAAGALGQLGGRHRRAVGHGLVEPELVADDHERRGRRRAHVLDEPAHELLELLFVDGWRRRHESLLPLLAFLGFFWCFFFSPFCCPLLAVSAGVFLGWWPRRPLFPFFFFFFLCRCVGGRGVVGVGGPLTRPGMAALDDVGDHEARGRRFGRRLGGRAARRGGRARARAAGCEDERRGHSGEKGE